MAEPPFSANGRKSWAESPRSPKSAAAHVTARSGTLEAATPPLKRTSSPPLLGSSAQASALSLSAPESCSTSTRPGPNLAGAGLGLTWKNAGDMATKRASAGLRSASQQAALSRRDAYTTAGIWAIILLPGGEADDGEAYTARSSRARLAWV